MLKHILTIVFVIGIITARSQSTIVKSFRWLDPALNTVMPSPKKDLTGKEYAIIKVETNQTSFDFDFGSPKKVLATVHKEGEIWIWVTTDIQSVTISNKLSGVLCNYPFGKELESFEVYVMRLNAENATASGENKVSTKWLTIDSSPLGADLLIDGFHAGQTPYYGSLVFGTHNLEMKLNGETKTDSLTIGKEEASDINIAFETDSTEKNDSANFVQKDQSAGFKDGSQQMLRFLMNNLRFPSEAQEKGINGTVYVQFKLSETGKISDVKVLKGIGGGCDEEAIRVVMLMPKWNPCKINGRAVPILLSLPVKFQSLGTIIRK